MILKKSIIAAMVRESSEKYGDRNPQQFSYLSARFSKADQLELSQGLLSIFTEDATPPVGSAAQELAGKLLMELRPKASVDLLEVLRQAVRNYELSVEEFPQFLATFFGVDEFISALDLLEKEFSSPNDLQALSTMKFWVRGMNSH